MRSIDITPGTEVLATSMPAYSSRFSLQHAHLVTVVAVGVHHTYKTEGNFTDYGRHVTNDRGVLVRWEDGQESVKRPEHLHEASEANMAKWKRFRADRAEAASVAEQVNLRKDRIREALEPVLGEVGFGYVSLELSLDQAEALLILLEVD